MLGHDLKSGILYRKRLLLVPIAIACLCEAAYTRVFLPFESNSTFGMVLCILMRGEQSAQSLTKGQPLDIPVLWLLFETGALLFTAEYPVGDLEKAGIQIFVRCKSRIRWWLSKCTWLILSVILYNLTIYAVIALYCFLEQLSLSLSVPGEYLFEVLSCFNTTIEEIYSSGTMLVQIIFVPVLMMIVLNLFQMLVAFSLNRMVGFIVAEAWLVWSIFQISPLAIGNYGMIQRSRLFDTAGLSFAGGVPLLCVLGLAAVIPGCLLIKRKNILYTQRET